MDLTSFYFFASFLISVIIFYLFPRRYQWFYLLLFSLAFFICSSEKYTVVFLLASSLITFLSTGRIAKHHEGRMGKRWMLLGIIGNLSMLVLLKYLDFLLGNINALARIISKVPTLVVIPTWAAPIGISYYTLSVIGYIVDCYSGLAKPNRNILKDLLFTCYWPILTSGPILKHSEIQDQLFSEHGFDFERLCFGLQRMLWGVIKKIVISARLGIIVDTILNDISNYDGFYIWIAAITWVLQLYTDFSGCMDIVLGASECYGIILPENFRTPFFACSVQEFWQRWHITLGTWYREYILYPILNTKTLTHIEKGIKKKHGKKVGRIVTSGCGMFFVWLLFGLWHGGAWKYIAMGLYFWTIIVFETCTNKLFERLWKKLCVPVNTGGWRFLQCLKVFILVTIGYMFFRSARLVDTFTVWGQIFRFNPWIFFDGSLYNLGLPQLSFNIMVFGVIALIIVSCYQRRVNVRQMISRQPLVIRWGIYLLLIFVPVVFGIYGPGYDAQAFIYKGF